jgi:hypothetical protein
MNTTQKPARKRAKKSEKKLAPAQASNSGGVSYDAAALIQAECDELANMLVEKNRRYGNSALEPVRCLSKASTEEQLLVRFDDKVSRFRAAATGDDEDVLLDMLGYLVLLRVARSLAPIPYRLTGGAK